MPSFFQTQRRRDGAVMLAVSLALMVSWLRSRVVSDEFMIEGQLGRNLEEVFLVRSHHDAFRYVRRVWSMRGGTHEEELWHVPYAAIVIPAALISGWLLLWPGTSTEKNSRTGKTP